MFIRFQFNLTLDLSGSTLTLQPLTTSSRTRRSRQKLSWVSLEAQLDSSGLSGDIGRFRENTQLGAQASTNHQRAVESRCVRDGRESRDRMVLPDKYFFFKLLFNYYLKFTLSVYCHPMLKPLKGGGCLVGLWDCGRLGKRTTLRLDREIHI